MSMGDLLQDPFLVSVHILTEPGEAKTLQSAADRLLCLLHPQLTLFRVSERAERPNLRPRSLPDLHPSRRPYLSILLFLREDCEGEESHEQQLRRPPWRYHHTEQVKGFSFSPVMQDFFILTPGTPLWALRRVRYGNELVRFTIYCRYETYSEQVQLYRLLLRRPLAQMNQLYSFCVIYANHHMEIQLSFKRLPQGQEPIHTECTLMEIRVGNLGGLVPLLPHPCRPISDTRWQTKDYDGNKILLQVQGSSGRSRDTVHASPSSEACSFSPSDGHQKCTSHFQSSPQTPLPLHDSESVQCSRETVRAGWTDLHNRSIIPTASEAPHSTDRRLSAPHSSSLTTARFRINVDTLVGAKETDVDTGQAVISRSVDLSVVSAHLLPQTRTNPQLPSIATGQNPANKSVSKPKWNRGEDQSNGSARTNKGREVDKQEFFI